MKGKLICYTLGDASPNERVKFKKELSGYKDHSNGGKYSYVRKGILSTIPHAKPIRSVIIVGEKDKHKITRILDKYNAEYHVFSINIKPQDLNS